MTAALEKLGDSGLRLVKFSGFFATPCFPEGAGPDYVNAVASFTGIQDPYTVLSVLHDVEAEFGRQREVRWGQRVLDIDLIGLGAQVHPDPETQIAWQNLSPDRQSIDAPDQLILPHPRLQDRAFVLVPLAKVEPNWQHPVSGKTVTQMLDDLPEAEKSQVKPLNSAQI